MRRVHPDAPVDVVALGAHGVYSIAMAVEAQSTHVGALLKKYADRPISLADACLVRCAEIHQEARILTFDRDFSIYKWGRNKKFELLS